MQDNSKRVFQQLSFLHISMISKIINIIQNIIK